jgi:hypothetical protein
LRGHFRPEFLNRVDEIVIFHRLGMPELKKVVDIQTGILAERLKARGIHLKNNRQGQRPPREVKAMIPVYGARPLKRVIQRMLQDPYCVAYVAGGIERRADCERLKCKATIWLLIRSDKGGDLQTIWLQFIFFISRVILFTARILYFTVSEQLASSFSGSFRLKQVQPSRSQSFGIPIKYKIFA